jgi:hypothetical protein
MDLQNNNQIYGVHQGIQYGQNERVDELNKRICSRFISDSPLEPNFDPRPVSTKYALFPIVNRRKMVNEPSIPYPEYNHRINFTPTISRGPSAGYRNNVDIENSLRNQEYALQHGADQNVYVPASSSDLYNTTVVSAPSNQPHPRLFEQPQFSSMPHPNVENSVIGREQFCNHTRTQLRNAL